MTVDPAQRFSRRAFLATGVASAWTAKSWARVPGANESIRIGLVGGGPRTNAAMARVLAAGDGVRLAVSTTVSPEALPRWQDLAASREIDAVVAAPPLMYRGALTLAALESGKHVYVMPPLAPNASEAMAIRETAQGLGLCVQIGAEHCADSAWKAARARIASGALGGIRHASLRYSTANETSLFESLAETLTPIVATTGCPLPQRVAAVGGRHDGDECKPPEMLMLSADFSGGWTLRATSYEGSGMQAAIRGQDGDVEIRSDFPARGHGLMREWIRAIRSNGDCACNAEAGTIACAIAEAAFESHLRSAPIIL